MVSEKAKHGLGEQVVYDLSVLLIGTIALIFSITLGKAGLVKRHDKATTALDLSTISKES